MLRMESADGQEPFNLNLGSLRGDLKFGIWIKIRKSTASPAFNVSNARYWLERRDSY